jgi:hypothetical protein
MERYSARVSAWLRAHAWGRRYGDLALAVLSFLPGVAHQGVDLRAGARPDGGFSVTARIPVAVS